MKKKISQSGITRGQAERWAPQFITPSVRAHFLPLFTFLTPFTTRVYVYVCMLVFVHVCALVHVQATGQHQESSFITFHPSF